MFCGLECPCAQFGPAVLAVLPPGSCAPPDWQTVGNWDILDLGWATTKAFTCHPHHPHAESKTQHWEENELYSSWTQGWWLWKAELQESWLVHGILLPPCRAVQHQAGQTPRPTLLCWEHFGHPCRTRTALVLPLTLHWPTAGWLLVNKLLLQSLS